VPLPSDLPVVDHHCHLSPSGEGVRAAERFQKAGGTHLFLTTQQYGPALPSSVDDYRTQFEATEALGRQIREQLSIGVSLVVAPYPIDLVRASETMGVPAAVELQRSALDLAGRWVEEQRAVALGEVGRPHFEVPAAIADASDEVFRYALSVARDADCPAVVHCADLDAAGYRELAQLAAQSSFPVGRLIKHYARQAVPAAERGGIGASYLAKRELVDRVLEDSGVWFLETDYLDDPSRPGSVLDLATVPRRAQALQEKGPEQLERLRMPFVSAIEKVYGFTPVGPAGVP
jgi:TatD-related deoxyribonuclease